MNPFCKKIHNYSNKNEEKDVYYIFVTKKQIYIVKGVVATICICYGQLYKYKYTTDH